MQANVLRLQDCGSGEISSSRMSGLDTIWLARDTSSWLMEIKNDDLPSQVPALTIFPPSEIAPFMARLVESSTSLIQIRTALMEAKASFLHLYQKSKQELTYCKICPLIFIHKKQGKK